MADIIKLTPDQQRQYEQWAAERPTVIQAMLATHPPTKLYRLRDTDQRVTIQSYAEDGTMTTLLTGQYNEVMFDRQVFGVRPEDLTECDLPAPGERLGTMMKDPESVQTFVNVTRPLVLNTADKTRLTKELHDKSGVGLMRAKMVLIAHDWDIEAAIKTLIRESNERHRW